MLTFRSVPLALGLQALAAVLWGNGLAHASPVPAAIGTPGSESTLPASGVLPPAISAAGCLSGGRGYLRARIRGALQADVDWHDDRALECEGDIRANGRGIRLSFAGPVAAVPGPAPGSERRLRLIFGIDSAAEGSSGRDLPINVTVILEGEPRKRGAGEPRLYSTFGGDKCTADELRQQPLASPDGRVHAYRVTVRGFCFAPARSLSGGGEIVVTRFDFSGRVARAEESHR